MRCDVAVSLRTSATVFRVLAAVKSDSLPLHVASLSTTVLNGSTLEN